MRILVIDVGGTHVKVLATGHKQRVEIPSGPKMTPAKMVSAVRTATVGWKYDAVSIGYPGAVVHGRPIIEPYHLGSGWLGFDFTKAFGRPVKIVNDAAMQALGSYHGGRMLFLGLGTGLGSALIVDNVLEPMELAHLPYKKGRTYEDYVGLAGLERLGKKKWRRQVKEVVQQLRAPCRLTTLCSAEVMPDCSRNSRPARAWETTPTPSEAAIVFGPSLTAAPPISGSSINP